MMAGNYGLTCLDSTADDYDDDDGTNHYRIIIYLRFNKYINQFIVSSSSSSYKQKIIYHLNASPDIRAIIDGYID